MKPLLRRGIAWAGAARAAALFVLPLPLLVAITAALVRGDVNRLALSGGALALLWGAGILDFKALVAEARYFLGEAPDPPVVPLKTVSAILTAIGVALAALAGGHDVLAALAFAGLGLGGHLAFFGLDVKPARIQVVEVAGVDVAAVTLQLKQAYGRLRGIERAGQKIALPEFRERLLRITGIGRAIVGEIEHAPAEAGRARRFLNLYLDSAERITQDYARTHGRLRNQPLDENFRTLLVDLENNFAEQHKRLVQRDQLSLDVDIEVLNTRLKREGLG